MFFATRVAPVQISWLGYPNTTGLKNIDYRFVDEITDPLPDAQAFSSEKLVHIKGGFLCYDALEEIPLPDHAPVQKNGWITFGSFNNIIKVTDQVLELWCEILRSVPNSKLLIKDKLLSDEMVRQGIFRVIERCGIAKERLILREKIESLEGHMRAYDEIDIGLDPFPYNGTTTTFEALWMGLAS